MDKFHEQIMIFDKVKGYLVILEFRRAQKRDSEGPLRKNAIEFDEEVLDTPNIYGTCLI